MVIMISATVPQLQYPQWREQFFDKGDSWEMNRLGIIVDLSHGAKSFYDARKSVRRPRLQP